MWVAGESGGFGGGITIVKDYLQAVRAARDPCEPMGLSPRSRENSTSTGMENGKIRTVFSAILQFKKPAHRSVAPEYALAIATSSTHARDFSQAAALPTQLCLTDQRFIRPPTPLFGKRSRSLGSVAERSASHFPMSVKLHEH